ARGAGGLGIPVGEARAFEVPVVALAATAVPETLGGGGIVVDRGDPPSVAGIVHRVLGDGALQARVVARQREALKRFSAADARMRLAAILAYHRSGTWSPLVTWSHLLEAGGSGASHAGG